MKNLLLAFIFVVGAVAQSQATLTLALDRPIPVQGLTQGVITISVAGSQATNIESLQFELALSGGKFMAAGAEVIGTSGKTLVCANRLSPDLSDISCVYIGTTATSFSSVLIDGPIAKIPVIFPSKIGTSTILMLQTLGATTDPTTEIATEVIVVPNSMAFPVGVSSCDMNGDGSVNIIDTQLATNAVNKVASGTLAWTLTLQNLFKVIMAVSNQICLTQ